jgi:hypothetical protein
MVSRLRERNVTFSTIIPRYDRIEDRLLVAIHVGKDHEWACWLTRRVVLAALGSLREYLDRSSFAAGRAANELDEVVKEGASAITKTRRVTQILNEKLTNLAARAEFAVHLSLAPHRNSFLFRLRGRDGGQAQVLLTRAELQIVVAMIEQEVVIADWVPKIHATTQQTLGEKRGAAPQKNRLIN